MAGTATGVRRPTALIISCILVLWTTPLSAEVYRWVDEHGRVHYGDRPRHADQQPIQVTPPEAAQDPDLEQRRQRRDRLLRIFAEDREREQAAARERAQTETRRRAECRRARETLHGLERGGRYFSLDDSGTRRYLNEQELARTRAHWRAEVRRLCDGQ